MKEHRKLAAIMFTDIVGYTALMSKDEQNALRILQKSRDLLKSFIKQFNGEWLQAIGDGTLSSFASVVDAVNCALEVQRSLKSEPELSLRIGIHIGDVISGEGEIYGDGVNVASRLETLAEPGGICISDKVYSEIRNKPDMEAVFLGEKTLKNVDLPLKIYALTVKELPAAMAESYPAERFSAAKTRPHRKRVYLYLGAAILLISLIMGGLYLFTLPREAEAIDSLAVLPLKNLSGDPEQEYFADGMTDALIAELGKIKALRVISRTSVMQYKEARKPLPEIARELNVDALVEGTILPVENKVRITVQLIKAVPEQHLWSDDYERDLREILTLQKEVARAIAQEIKIVVTPKEQERLERVQPVDPEAYQAYLRGRHFYNRFTEEGLKKGIEYFELAIDKDPTYAPAYAGLASCSSYLGINAWLSPEEAYPKAKAAAMKALELDKTLGEAHALLGFIKFLYDWDLYGPEMDFGRALELSPGSVEVHDLFNTYLLMMGRFEEAIEGFKYEIELDPVTPVHSEMLGLAYCFAGRYDESIMQIKKSLELDPNFYWSHMVLSFSYALKGMYPEALAQADKMMALFPSDDQTMLGFLGWVYGVSGKREVALKLLNQIQGLSSRKYVDAYYVASIYAGLGEKDQTIEWLTKAYEERSSMILFLKIDPWFDNLRSESRFTELLKKIGFDK